MMFNRRRKQKEAERIQRMRELRGEIAILTDRLSQLRDTRIRISVPTELGVRPLYDVQLEYGIMLTNMMNGAEPGYKVEGMTVEVVSQYTPLMIPDEEDMRYANDDSPGN